MRLFCYHFTLSSVSPLFKGFLVIFIRHLYCNVNYPQHIYMDFRPPPLPRPSSQHLRSAMRFPHFGKLTTSKCKHMTLIRLAFDRKWCQMPPSGERCPCCPCWVAQRGGQANYKLNDSKFHLRPLRSRPCTLSIDWSVASLPCRSPLP